MEQSPSWEATSHSDGQEIPRLLWSPKVHYCLHMSTSLAPILSQTHPINTFPPYFPKTHSNIILHLRLGLPSGLFPSGFSNFVSIFRCLRRYKKISPIPRPCVTFRNKLEDCRLSAVRDCLFNTIPVTFHIWRPSPPSATLGHAMLW
jgi:hypothetical protein